MLKKKVETAQFNLIMSKRKAETDNVNAEFCDFLMGESES